jgi:RHS repeat-associated protein
MTECVYGAMINSSSASYYRARYYDPQIGRFVREDPLGFGAGANFYPYVGNEPTIFDDPTGEQQQAGVAAPTAPPVVAPPVRPIVVPDPTPPPPVPATPGFWPSTAAEAGAALALLYYDIKLATIELDMIKEYNERNTPQPNPSPTPAPKPPACKDKDKDCDLQYENDSSVCRMLPNKNDRRRCWASAFQRYRQCLRGQPALPLEW